MQIVSHLGNSNELLSQTLLRLRQAVWVWKAFWIKLNSYIAFSFGVSPCVSSCQCIMFPINWPLPSWELACFRDFFGSIGLSCFFNLRHNGLPARLLVIWALIRAVSASEFGSFSCDAFLAMPSYKVSTPGSMPSVWTLNRVFEYWWFSNSEEHELWLLLRRHPCP